MMGGQMLQVQTPSGMMQVQIPQGLQAGQVFQMQVPMRAPQQQAMPMAQPVMQQPVMQQPVVHWLAFAESGPARTSIVLL